VPTPCFALASMVLLQLGIAASKPLFGPLGATGATSLRMLVAAAVLVAATRPRLRGKTPRQLAAAVLLGVVSGFMTLTFAASVARIPMGVTSTIEYLGPLVVALAGTRRALDAVWALLAAGGVALITLTAAGGAGAGGLDPVGLGFAAAAAVCWGLYLVLTKRVGTAFDGFQGLAVSISVGALTVAPIGLGRGLHGLAAAGDPAGPAAGWSWWLLLLAVAGAAMLFPVLPYALEMTALRRIQPRLLGILFSLEPAVAALIGLLVLGQALGWSQVGGMACVVGASLAATLTARVD
jgi:inner membrane transporter RhtA